MTDQRRITEQLLLYWSELKGGREFPSFEDLSPEGIEDLWPDCYVLRVLGEPANSDYEFVYMGENVVRLFGEEIYGPKSLPFPERVVAAYEQVVAARSAIVEEDSFENMKHQTVMYRQVLLPLGDGEEQVDHIIGGIRHKGGGELGDDVGDMD